MSKALELKPEWPLYLCNRGKTYMILEEWDEAMDDFDDVYDQLETLDVGEGLSQANLDFIQRTMDGDRKECIKKGGFEEEYKGEVQKTYKGKKKIDADPSQKTAIQWYSDGYNLQMKQFKHREAYEAYKKAAEVNPKYANAYFGMASCQKNFKEYENALANYNKFLELNPTYADAIYNKGDILVCLGRLEEAIEWMTKAIVQRPEWPLYYCNRGKQYIKLGKQRLALADLNKAYAHSKDMKESAQLTAGNIQYIKNTLSNERETLLKEINALDEKEKKLAEDFKKIKNKDNEHVQKAMNAFSTLKKKKEESVK